MISKREMASNAVFPLNFCWFDFDGYATYRPYFRDFLLTGT